MNLSFLPDLCLIAIFRRLSLRDLFNVGNVCHRFKYFRHKLLVTRRSLTLLIGQSSHELIKQSPFDVALYSQDTASSKALSEWSSTKGTTFNLKRFSPQCALWLASSLPNVITLRVSVRNVFSPFCLESVAFLLDKWANQLVTFKFWFFSIRTSEGLSHLVGSINKLCALRSLTFEVMKFSPDKVNLTILSQVEEAFLFIPSTESVLELIKRTIPNNKRIQRIGLAIPTYLDFSCSVAQIFERDSSCLNMKHKMKFNFCQITDFFETIYGLERYPNVVESDEDPIPEDELYDRKYFKKACQIVTPLLHPQSGAHLYLDCRTIRTMSFETHPSMADQLIWVRSLTIFVRSLQDITFLQMEVAFPNLEVLHIFSCDKSTTAAIVEDEPIIRQTVSKLYRQLPRLRRIYSETTKPRVWPIGIVDHL